MVLDSNGMTEIDRGSPLILAIDDDEPNLRLLAAILARQGFATLKTTTDPRLALSLFESFRPDLVLIDLHMPGMDGFAVMEQIRASPLAGGYLPIVMLTGDQSAAVRQRALASGATDIVLKPYDSIEVGLRIRNLLETRRLHAKVHEQNLRLEEMVRKRTIELEAALYRAEAATEAKNGFLAKMSHELRTPLNPIRGALELLNDEASPQTARLLDMAGRNVDRMCALIDDILYLQGMEQGNIRPEVYPVHLAAVVREVVEAAEARARRAGLHLAMEAPSQLPPIPSDAALLIDVLRRLIDNALRFTQQGGVTVRIEAEPGSGLASRIEVEDTGIGIPLNQMDLIFEPFEQADNSNTRRYEGAGLGLSICKQLCELLGFRLVASSRPGEGSTFSVLVRHRPR